MPFSTTPHLRNRALNDQLLDVSKLSSGQENNPLEWDISAQSNISFRHIVEENNNPRADAQRYKLIADINIEGARAAFSRACSSTTLFKIPDSITCDRTFARDAYEAYYVDAMHKYLEEPPGELRVEDIPVLKFPLHSRYFCAFARRPLYFTEMFQRRRLGHWIPGDSPDLDFFSDLQKISWFPKVEAWFMLLSQPCALPIPLPFVLYYFHNEIRFAQRFPAHSDSERIRRLLFCLEHEYCIFFLAVWWNELYHGGRAFVIKHETINVLEAKCGNILNISGKPAQAIIERMRMFADMPQRQHNWLCFPDREMEQSTFIFAVKKVGVPDHNAPCRRRFWCSRDHRGITVSRYTSETYRRLTLLDQRITGPDLDNIPGLSSLVREHEWDRYNSMRVSELLHNLLSLYVNTCSRLDDSRKAKMEEERRYDRLGKDFELLREELRNCRGTLEDTKYQLEAACNTREDTFRKLDDANREIDRLKARAGADQRQTNDTLRRVHSIQNYDQMASPRSPHYFPTQDGGSQHQMQSNQPHSGAPSGNARAHAALPNRASIATNPYAVIAHGKPRLTRGMIEAAAASTATPFNRAATPPTPRRLATPVRPSSPAIPRRTLPKIRPGYHFLPMPKPKRSAQTREIARKENMDRATPDETAGPHGVNEAGPSKR